LDWERCLAEDFAIWHPESELWRATVELNQSLRRQVDELRLALRAARLAPQTGWREHDGAGM
jgi:hypothetical protein